MSYYKDCIKLLKRGYDSYEGELPFSFDQVSSMLDVLTNEEFNDSRYDDLVEYEQLKKIGLTDQMVVNIVKDVEAIMRDESSKKCKHCGR